MIPRIAILFAGGYGVGKTTLANSVAELIGGQKLSFAQGIREEVSSALNIPMESFTNKPSPDWARRLLRGYGDYWRSLDPDYWVEQAIGRVTSELVVFDDLRFTREVDYLRELGIKCKIVYLGAREENYELDEIFNYYARHYLPAFPDDPQQVVSLLNIPVHTN